jgi:ribonuclease P protein component
LGARDTVTAPEEGPQTAHREDRLQTRGPVTATERLPRLHRLARSIDLKRCQEQGRRRRTRHLEFIWCDNSSGHPRMGLIVPRYHSSAVARNRLRRRLREVWRREVQGMQGGCDLVVRARREAYSASYTELRSQVVGWAAQLAGSRDRNP